MDYDCRKLTAADIAMVMEMNQNFREGFARYESALAFLENTKNWLFAAVREGVVIGFAYGYELERLDGGAPMLYLHEVGVMEREQRQGVGYRMMSLLKEDCRKRGIGKYFLSAYQNNAGANALYRKLGGSVSPESQGNDTDYYFSTR